MGCVHAEKQEVCVWLCVLTCLLFPEPCAVVMWLLSLFLKWTAWLHVSMHTQQWSAAQVRVHTAYENKHTHTHNIFDFQSNLAEWECLNTRDFHPFMISFKLSLRDLISAWLLKTIPIHLCSNSFTHEYSSHMNTVVLMLNVMLLSASCCLRIYINVNVFNFWPNSGPETLFVFRENVC